MMRGLALVLAVAAALRTGTAAAEDDPLPSESEFISSGICIESVGYGPLTLSSQSPVQVLRPTLLPYTPSTILEGDMEFIASAAWTNLWARKRDGSYIVDLEQLRLGVVGRYGLTDRLNVQLEVPFLIRGGGFMDGMIEGFHDTFGIRQAGRDDFSRNEFRVEIEAEPGSRRAMDREAARAGIMDTVLGLQYNVTCGTEWLPAIGIGVSLKIPTGSDGGLRGSPGFDPGVNIAVSRRFVGWLYGYLNLGFAYYGNDDVLGLELRPYQASALAALEFRATDNLAILVQILGNTAGAKDFHEFSKPTTEITLGAKWEIDRLTVLELGLIENLFIFENSPDFGVHFGVTRRF
jgi:hypothetical protein